MSRFTVFGTMGDGAYLFDPQGDLRASMIYPCLAPCADPLRGAVHLGVHPSTPEEVTVTNDGAAPADLRPYVLKLHLRGHANRFVWSYHFHGDATLGSGETMRVWVGRGPGGDTRLSKGMGRGSFELTDAGNAISLRSYTDAVVDCYAWGSGGRC